MFILFMEEKNPMKIKQIIKRIIDYIEPDEKRHYEECNSDEKKYHVYNDIQTVHKWLNKTGKIK